LDTATRCGLILNELISNAIKYAFRNRTSGLIHVSLKYDDSINQITLVVYDNGIGMKADIDMKKSLGLRLVTLVAKQIEAELTFSVERGTRFTITFTKPAN